MEHKKYNQTIYGFDIVKIIETHVRREAEIHWKGDKCPPEFWITLNNEDMDNQQIMISISHLNVKFTETLFPRKNTQYGYDSVLNQMINMYNQTM